jgi:hypothetical protein
VRDSKDPDGGHLTLSVAEFVGLIVQVKRHQARGLFRPPDSRSCACSLRAGPAHVRGA